MRSLAVLIVVALSTPALAQAPGQTIPQPLSSPATPAEEKGPDTAVLLSVGVTGAGLLTIIAGSKDHSGTAALVGIGAMYFGPSVGRWYAGSDGIGSLGLRAVGGASALLGLAMIIGSEDCEGNCHEAVAASMFFGGLGLWAGTSIYDIVMAGSDAHRWNREHASLQLRPTTVSMAGHHGVGLALAGHF